LDTDIQDSWYRIEGEGIIEEDSNLAVRLHDNDGKYLCNALRDSIHIAPNSLSPGVIPAIYGTNTVTRETFAILPGVQISESDEATSNSWYSPSPVNPRDGPFKYNVTFSLTLPRVIFGGDSTKGEVSCHGKMADNPDVCDWNWRCGRCSGCASC
jgi:hypothetical protein